MTTERDPNESGAQMEQRMAADAAPVEPVEEPNFPTPDVASRFDAHGVPLVSDKVEPDTSTAGAAGDSMDTEAEDTDQRVAGDGALRNAPRDEEDPPVAGV